MFSKARLGWMKRWTRLHSAPVLSCYFADCLLANPKQNSRSPCLLRQFELRPLTIAMEPLEHECIGIMEFLLNFRLAETSAYCSFKAVVCLFHWVKKWRIGWLSHDENLLLVLPGTPIIVVSLTTIIGVPGIAHWQLCSNEDEPQHEQCTQNRL